MVDDISLAIITRTLRQHEYEIRSMIGRGGFSDVFKVRSHQYGIDFAVKVIPACKYDTKEFDQMSRLIHTNIISIYDVFHDTSFNYMVLELCSKGSLQDMVADRPIQLERLLWLCTQIIDALMYIHSENIFHGDIKPANILLDDHLRPKIADFGLSQLINGVSFTEQHHGSIPYMAPEQFTRGAFDPVKVDVWQLGVTFYHLAFGRIPWLGKTKAQMVEAITRVEISYPPNANRDFVAVLQRMLSEDPAKRPCLFDLMQMPLFAKPRLPKLRDALTNPSFGTKLAAHSFSNPRRRGHMSRHLHPIHTPAMNF